MPISNYEGDVIGVAQIINKTSGKSSKDVEFPGSESGSPGEEERSN